MLNIRVTGNADSIAVVKVSGSFCTGQGQQVCLLGQGEWIYLSGQGEWVI